MTRKNIYSNMTPDTDVMQYPMWGTILAQYDAPERSTLYRALMATDLWSEPSVAAALALYHVMATADGGTVLPQVDAAGNMRTARIKYYGLDGGEDESKAGWVHYELKRQGILPWERQLRQCAFGADQLPLFPHNTVCIVPREITAVTCELCLSEYVWLAVGRRLRADMLECLRGRHVLIYPDADLMTDWRRDARYIRGCASLTVVPWCAGNTHRSFADALTEGAAWRTISRPVVEIEAWRDARWV